MGESLPSISFGLLTVSDRCARGERDDLSGAKLKECVLNSQRFAGSIREQLIVPDDISAISETLKKWCDCEGVDVVLTTGGTGFHARDVTPDATRAVGDRECGGIVAALTARSLAATPNAALSRLAAVIRGRSLVINLPGSLKAVAECWEVLDPIIKHAVHHLREERGPTDAEHKRMQQTRASSVKLDNVAGRERQSPWPLISVDEALNIVFKETEPLGEVVHEPLMRAHGCVVAEDMLAPESHPAFAASIKDGYAVRFADGAGPHSVRAVVTAAAHPEATLLEAGWAARISTGAPLPPGADAVVQVEDTRLLQAKDGEELEVDILVAPSKTGQDVRNPGSDIARGEQLLPKGAVIGAAEVGLLASMGITSVPVFRKPTVAVLSTGNEVRDWRQTQLVRGEIRDANRPGLLASLAARGFPTIDAGVAIDQPEVLLEAIVRSLKRADVLVTSGGVSMGERDLLKEVLKQDLGFTIHFGRVFMKPGKPTAFASGSLEGKRKLVFGLPGNPVSSFVTSQLYVFPALQRMEGRLPFRPSLMGVVTGNEMRLDPRPEFHRASATGELGAESRLPVAVSTHCNQSSSRLANSQGATMLLKLPAASAETGPVLPVGSKVDAILIYGRL